MGIVNMVRNMKQVHPTNVLLIKVGKFYHAYGKDAYIISFLFDYQLKKVEGNTNTTGFPETALNKIQTTLEEKNINYMLISRANNYEVVEEYDFKKENTYNDVYFNAHKYQSRKNKADEIYEYLLNNINEDFVKEKMNQIEEILYATGQI